MQCSRSSSEMILTSGSQLSELVQVGHSASDLLPRIHPLLVLFFQPGRSQTDSDATRSPWKRVPCFSALCFREHDVSHMQME